MKSFVHLFLLSFFIFTSFNAKSQSPSLTVWNSTNCPQTIIVYTDTAGCNNPIISGQLVVPANFWANNYYTAPPGDYVVGIGYGGLPSGPGNGVSDPTQGGVCNIFPDCDTFIPNGVNTCAPPSGFTSLCFKKKGAGPNSSASIAIF
ncbi:hypothetical protein [Dokdonia sp.]|uniref:hypothetical protein n=1 Tax=Dokdonia sp. TaxID=2024995 RepID=UPI003263D836